MRRRGTSARVVIPHVVVPGPRPPPAGFVAFDELLVIDDVSSALDAATWNRLLDGRAAKEIEFARMMDEHYFIVRQGSRARDEGALRGAAAGRGKGRAGGILRASRAR